MSLGIAAPKPPYVMFTTKAIEDRNRTIESGRYAAKDVDFAVITPQGSKDQIERRVDEWFEKLENDTMQGRFEVTWLDHFKRAYDSWKKGKEIPVEGTPILTWPLLSPSQVQLLIECNIRTVEDLANCNEQAIASIGIGARNLKMKAVEWLKVANDSGKTTEAITALRSENDELKKTIESLSQRLENAEKSFKVEGKSK